MQIVSFPQQLQIEILIDVEESLRRWQRTHDYGQCLPLMFPIQDGDEDSLYLCNDEVRLKYISRTNKIDLRFMNRNSDNIEYKVALTGKLNGKHACVVRITRKRNVIIRETH